MKEMNVNWKVLIIIGGFCLYVYEEVSPCFGNAHTQHILLKQKLHLGIAKVIAKVKVREVLQKMDIFHDFCQ